MIDEVFRKNKTTQKIADAEERFLKISPLPDGSKVVDTRSSRLTYVADPVDDKDAINKSWATKYFKDEKDAVTKLGESATAKSAELDTKLVKFNSDKDSIERTGEELKVLSAETKSRAEETKTKLESTLAQLEQAKTKIDNFNADYARAKELKGDVEGKATEVKANLESVRAVLNAVTAKSEDILSTYTNAKQDLQSTGSTAKQELQGLSASTKQEIARAKASIDTRANEALNQASTALTDIRGIVADFRGKQTELNALKANLETLKNSLESLNRAGVINDTQAGVAQTYSSNKINNLLQGVLRESDASEGNANGKLVKRNAQGNIYATNVYLNATTKAEVSDIKSSLASDRWRFIVRDTGEGLLRSMSIKDFINSQEVDAYTKEQADRYFIKKGDVSNENEANKVVVRGQNGFISVGTIASYTSITSPAYDIFLEKNNYDYTFGVFFNNSLYRVRARDIKGYLDNYYADKKITEKGLNDIRANIPPRNKPNGYAGLDAKGKITLDLLPYTENIVELSNEMSIDPRKGKNFIITLDSTRGDFSFWPTQFGVGQGGVIVVKGANRIESWNSNIKWREVPTDLGETEVFSYFIASASEVYMGRA